MDKLARKPSSDPAQEKLRQNKALWNKEVSVFINDLINFKKTMNGAPSKFHPEKSNIKEPIPADPATIVGVLANDFQEIAQKGNAIVSQQLEYSKTRRKSQPKAPVAPGTPPAAAVPAPEAPAAPDLSKQLAAFERKYELVAEGSNKITRFFTKLFNPAVGFGNAADLRRARMAMLNACADTYRNLGKFQVQVVKSSKASIMDANKLLNEANNSWNLLTRAYVIYKSSKSVDAADKGGDIEQQVKLQDFKDEKVLENLDRSVQDFEASSKKGLVVAPPEEAMDQVPEDGTPDNIGPDLSPLYRLEQVKNMVADYRRYQEYLPPNDGAGGYLYELDAAVDKFIASRGKKIAPDFDQFYEKSIRYLNEDFGTTATSFKDLVTQLRARVKTQLKPAPAPAPTPTPAPAPVVTPVTPEPTTTEPEGTEKVAAQMEKVAQDFLKKWVGKTMHQLSLFDKTSTHRLSSYKLAGELRKELDQIMDLLEKGLNEDELDPLIKHANSQIVALRGMMRSLHLAVPQPKAKKLGK